MGRLAVGPSLKVRACVAHMLHAAIRHDRLAARLMPSRYLSRPRPLDRVTARFRLAVALRHGDVEAAGRMPYASGGACTPGWWWLDGNAAMAWENPGLFTRVLAGNDTAQRQGTSDVSVQRFPDTGDTALAHRALARSFHDPMRSCEGLPPRCSAGALSLSADIDRTDRFWHSRAALPQLLIRLGGVRDRVDDPALTCVRRFVAVFGAVSADSSCGAAAESRHIGRLLVRAHDQETSLARHPEFLSSGRAGLRRGRGDPRLRSTLSLLVT